MTTPYVRCGYPSGRVATPKWQPLPERGSDSYGSSAEDYFVYLCINIIIKGMQNAECGWWSEWVGVDAQRTSGSSPMSCAFMNTDSVCWVRRIVWPRFSLGMGCSGWRAMPRVMWVPGTR